MPVYWYDGLSVGNAEIDGQHKKLLDMINDLESALAKKQGYPELGDIARRMQDYARYHFSTEEKHMEFARYPEKAAHLAEHEVFIERAMGLSFTPDDTGNHPQKVLEFLRDWLITHIHGTDKLLGAFLQGM